MSDQESWPAWIWVIMEQKGSADGFYALELENGQGKIIPVFRTQDEAGQVKFGLTRDKEATYQVEAMRLEVAAIWARKNHADLCMVNGEGEILERLVPIPDA